ncbi:hypothetical protein K502DRAFT_367395 [Neoconidiobolus thromboides FSU 785]|nr:hypothetical protein K502DRAFT_367395 [Neoconidiobolus thromboides FSU 785]
MLKNKTLTRCYNWVFLHKVRRRLFKFFIGAILWCVIVLPIFVAYSNEGSNGRSYKQIATQSELIGGSLNIQVDLMNVDPLNKKVDLFIQLDPIGDLSYENKTIKYDIDINFRFKRRSVPRGNSIEPFQLTVPFTFGNLRDYPLEEFIAYFPLEITTKNKSISKSGDPILVPTSVTFYGTSQLFRIRFYDLPEDEKTNDYFSTYTTLDESKIVAVRAVRPPTTLLVCSFMVVLMWCLAIAMINIAVDAVFNNREIPPPILGTSVSMLFALPALRNSQPGVPAMGCISDILGFFWCLVLISMVAVTLLFKWAMNLSDSKDKNQAKEVIPEPINLHNDSNHLGNKSTFNKLDDQHFTSSQEDDIYLSNIRKESQFDGISSIDSNLNFRGKI